MSAGSRGSPGALVPFEAPHRGGPFGRVLEPAFRRVPIEAEAERRLERAHQQGHVVHVIRSKRVLDPVFILHALDRLGLPKPTWMHDHYATTREPTAAAMLQAIEDHEPVLLFLRKPRTLTNPDASYDEDYVARLVAAQRKLTQPILLVPESLNWQARSNSVQRTIIDVVFGDRESPGEMREMLGFILRYAHARYHVGEPINLKSVLEREEGKPDEVIVKKVRWSLLNHLAREEAIRTGPMQRSLGRTRQLVLKDPSVQKLLSADSEEEREHLATKADRIVKKMAADMRLGWIRVLDAIVDRAWSKIFDGIVVDEAGLSRVWEAARRGPLVLVPSHKSHVDYLVLSQVFFRDGLMPPHIAAGENLSFWPVGPIFRRSGAFFIRRSFKGDKLYSAICAAYIKRLLKEGHAVEFFIEGGRSRTGKLLAPKMGILSMCIDPVFDGALTDVSFVPVSISYEKIIEARSYASELAGGEKKKEDVGALLSTQKVLRTRTRYGRVYIDFDEPISLRAFAAARGASLGTKDQLVEHTSELDRRSLTDQLGHRLVYGINAVTRVTPTGIIALILLSNRRRNLPEEELYRLAQRMTDFLERAGARLSHSLERNTQREALRETLGRFAQDGIIKMLPGRDSRSVYEADGPGRQALDYYKNNVLHLLLAPSIVCTGVLALTRESGAALERDLRDDARRLSQILKHEFSFRAGDSGFEQSFVATVASLKSEGLVHETEIEGEPALRPTARGRELVGILAEMPAPFLESYRHVVRELCEIDDEISEKDLLSLCLREGRRGIGDGVIRRAEAVSKITIDNAVRLLIDLGLLERRPSGRLGPGKSGRTGLKSLAEELSRYLSD